MARKPSPAAPGLLLWLGVALIVVLADQFTKVLIAGYFCFAVACIMGGALGNVIDRMWHGYVIDFLDFHLADVHFWAFNLADSAITLGAACLILDEVLRVRRTG